jgi:hypothetical protein
MSPYHKTGRQLLLSILPAAVLFPIFRILVVKGQGSLPAVPVGPGRANLDEDFNDSRRPGRPPPLNNSGCLHGRQAQTTDPLQRKTQVLKYSGAQGHLLKPAVLRKTALT